MTEVLVESNYVIGAHPAGRSDGKTLLGPGGELILSGILRWQENLVLGFYRPHGLILRERRRDGNWSALLLDFMVTLAFPPAGEFLVLNVASV